MKKSRINDFTNQSLIMICLDEGLTVEKVYVSTPRRGGNYMEAKKPGVEVVWDLDRASGDLDGSPSVWIYGKQGNPRNLEQLRFLLQGTWAV